MSLRSVVPALRCPCAPLSLRSVVPALLRVISLLLFLTSAANAGTWQARANDPLYACTGSTTGGAIFLQGPNTSLGPTTALGQGPIGSSMTVSGTVSFQWTWIPANPQDLPPLNVILAETVTPSKSIQYGDGNGTVSPAATTTYEIKDSHTGKVTLTLPISATLTFTENNSASMVTVWASATITTVLINLNGGLTDSNYQLNILVGQGCNGIISAGSYTLSGYQWTVPGVTFDHFYIASDQSQGYPVFVDPSVWTTASPLWHWSSSGNYNVLATAQASINSHLIGSVSAQKSITVVTPPQSVVATPGSSSFETNNGKVIGIQAGAYGAGGMDIGAIVITPNPFAQFGYYGTYFFAQLVSEQRYVSMGSIITPYTTRGFDLDNQWPYNGYQQSYSPEAVNPSPFLFDDAPDQGLVYMDGVNVHDQFKTYIMYQPPANGNYSQPVPIHLTQWNWTASAALYNGIWSPNPPGTCQITSDSASTEFPTWSASFVNSNGNTGRKAGKEKLPSEKAALPSTLSR